MLKGSRQLKSVILDLVKESFGDTLYNKALDCVKTLRGEVIKVQNLDPIPRLCLCVFVCVCALHVSHGKGVEERRE